MAQPPMAKRAVESASSAGRRGRGGSGCWGRSREPRASHLARGDNSASSCRSYSRAKGPGTSAGALPMAVSLLVSGGGPQGVLDGVRRGPVSRGTPRTPRVSSPTPHPRCVASRFLAGAGAGRAAPPPPAPRAWPPTLKSPSRHPVYFVWRTASDMYRAVSA